ncbi:expressed unknown protein [Seminavis robusta]|uniref:G-protein coupled receptors family 1 profile domain-containing protein n=1 Tax=Seminavis robusta TaxID=568900 RepID=A0A9N8HDA5_9STRA|nr:expressed unknown protein [Seminavis robusta]|eukprot:Sro418_g138860.1 n/a (634) ;mRNA; r:23594-25495
MSKYVPYVPLPDNLAIPLGVLLSISSFLSLVGSSCIIYMTRRDLSQMVQRLLLYISISDVCLTLTLLITPFALPQELDYSYAAFGNAQTCSAAGLFLATFVWTGCCYSCYLSLYYLATVRYNWKEPNLARRTSRLKLPKREIVLHCVTLLVPIIMGSIGLAAQVIHPTAILPICYFTVYPYGCTGQDEDYDDDRMQCEKYNLVFRLVAAASFLQGAVTITSYGATFWLYWTVRQKLRQSAQFQFKGSSTTAKSSISTTTNPGSSITSKLANSLTSSNTQPAEENPFQKRILQVRTQAILYALIYFNSGIWFTVLGGLSGVMDPQQIQEQKSQPFLYTLQVLSAFFGPLQGFLNFFVYIRPKVARWRTVEPDMSLVWIWRQILGGVEIPTSAAAAKRRRNKEQKDKQDALQGQQDTDHTSRMSFMDNHHHHPVPLTVTEEEKQEEEEERMQAATDPAAVCNDAPTHRPLKMEEYSSLQVVGSMRPVTEERPTSTRTEDKGPAYAQQSDATQEGTQHLSSGENDETDAPELDSVEPPKTTELGTLGEPSYGVQAVASELADKDDGNAQPEQNRLAPVAPLLVEEEEDSNMNELFVNNSPIAQTIEPVQAQDEASGIANPSSNIVSDCSHVATPTQ